LETQAPKEHAWALTLGLDSDRLVQESSLIACVDTLSLALCGELKAPLDIEAPGNGSNMRILRLAERRGKQFEFTLSPWPFRVPELIVKGEGLVLPSDGRFADEISMRQWLTGGPRVPFSAQLSPG
jgi:hypothetical protein